MKRSYCFFLLPILVASAGCPSTDNTVGSLGRDAGAADGSGQVASDGPSQAADMAGAGQDAGQKPPAADGPNSASTCVTNSDCPSGLSCGYAAADGCAAKGVCMKGDLQGAVGPDYMCGCDGQAILPIVINSSTVLYVSAPYSGWAGPCTGMPDSGVPDAAGVGQDAAPVSPEAGAAHQCQLNTDGTCSAVTSNTACTPFPGNRFDESAGCYSPVSTTLACCATLAGDYCHFAAGSGCYQIVAAGSTVTYWTPGLPDVNVAAPGGQYCDKAMGAKVPGAHSCSSTSPDAGSAPVLMQPTLPAVCLTDEDCCVSIDYWTGMAYLVGQTEFDAMNTSIARFHAGSMVGVNCLMPAVQVQCKDGFCMGERFPGAGQALRSSHCGHIVGADAGTGIGSSDSTWPCP